MNYRQHLLNATARPLPPLPDGEVGAGGGDKGGGGWDQTRATLAGGNQEHAALLEKFDAPDKLFAKLGETPAEFDWRKAMAGEDAEEQKRLERFTDLASVRQSWREAEKKIGEAGRVRIPGEGATPEEKAEWAKAYGAADKPDGYEITVKPPAGLVLGPEDQATLGRLQVKLHEAIVNGARAPDLMNVAHQIYFDEAANASKAAEERAIEAALDTEAELKSRWGAAYEDNVKWARAGAKQFFNPSKPERLDIELDEFMALQLPTGHKLGDHPQFLRMFSNVGRQLAEDPFFQRMRGENAGFDPDKRKAEIMKLRETNPKAYADPKIQEELDRLNAGIARRKETSGRAA